MTKTTIVVPVFNQAALTRRCLQTVTSDKAEIVVVDDASTDETAALLESLGSSVKVVRHSSNHGFSTSCNDGASIASGDYLVFLNNDTVPRAGWLEALIGYADAHPQAAVVGAKLLYPDETVQHAGVVICQDRYPRHIYTGFPADHPAVSKSREFQIVTGACMLVRRTAFMQAGGFSVEFRNGFEDVDLCLRLREQGHQVHYCAECVVQHLESVSPGRFKRDQDNVKLYQARWLPRVQPDDVQYYLEDGLFRLNYSGTFPIGIEISARLAVLDHASRSAESERLLEERAQEIADLRRENTRLALSSNAATSANTGSMPYEVLRKHLQETVRRWIPAGAQVLVASKGDRALLQLGERDAQHFPQTPKRTYAGHHPANAFDAIAHLEELRCRGAEYLVIPGTAFWWLDHYQGLRQHLTQQGRLIAQEAGVCMVFHLSPPAPIPPESNVSNHSYTNADAFAAASGKATK
jgi:GT2 family glycosyltransferase